MPTLPQRKKKSEHVVSGLKPYPSSKIKIQEPLPKDRISFLRKAATSIWPK